MPTARVNPTPKPRRRKPAPTCCPVCLDGVRRDGTGPTARVCSGCAAWGPTWLAVATGTKRDQIPPLEVIRAMAAAGSTDATIAKHLGITLRQVRHARLGAKIRTKRGRPTSNAWEGRIRAAHEAGGDLEAIALAPGYKPSTARAYLRKLGLRLEVAA